MFSGAGEHRELMFWRNIFVYERLSAEKGVDAGIRRHDGVARTEGNDGGDDGFGR
jgi:hypothetical protein